MRLRGFRGRRVCSSEGLGFRVYLQRLKGLVWAKALHGVSGSQHTLQKVCSSSRAAEFGFACELEIAELGTLHPHTYGP